MKERPIKFNAEMVQAILDGRKTQTRRPVKPYPKYNSYRGTMINENIHIFRCSGEVPPKYHYIRCPHGEPGDRLWVENGKSRILLEITDITVERLHDIIVEDCLAEGVKSHVELSKLWDSIYKERGYEWLSDPWVWVIRFKRIDVELFGCKRRFFV